MSVHNSQATSSRPQSHNSQFSGLPVLVLGASGFIGRWVARALTAAGAELALAVRNPAVCPPIFTEYTIAGTVYKLDAMDETAVTHLIHTIQPAITFNLIGYGVDRSEREEAAAEWLNGRLPALLAENIAALPATGWPGQRLVHVGSALEYGEIGGDLREESVTNATTLYGRTKLTGTVALAEQCQTQGVQGLTARLFTVYGPGEHDGRLLPALLHTARARQPLPLTAGTQQRDFTYVADVAEGLLRLAACADLPPGWIVNLATGKLTSVRRFVELAAAVLDIPPTLLQFGAIPTRREEMAHDPVNITRLRHALRWQPPTPIPVGVRQTTAIAG